MAGCEDLNVARKKLEASLGESSKQYFHLMKLWFQLKSTKEEFDAESRKLMTAEQIRLHNDFLLCLFNKCQSLASFSSYPPSSSKMSSKSTVSPSKSSSSNSMKDKTNKRTKVKRRNRSDKGNFEPADIADYISPPQALPPHDHDEPLLRYSSQELFLPDISLIFGRMLLSAWETGLEGAEKSAAEMLVIAVQHFLKNVLTVVLGRRRGYKIRENNFIYSLGTSVPNPWLCNTACVMDSMKSSLYTDENEEERPKSPGHKLTLDEIEQQAAFEIACGDVGTSAKYPVTSFQVLEALQVHRNVIPSHTIYSVNVERVINTLNHPTCEEMDGLT